MELEIIADKGMKENKYWKADILPVFIKECKNRDA